MCSGDGSHAFASTATECTCARRGEDGLSQEVVDLRLLREEGRFAVADKAGPILSLSFLDYSYNSTGEW